MVVPLLLCALAVAADLATELASLDAAARIAKLEALQGATTRVDEMASYGAALLVLAQLEAHGRTDPSVVKLFLRAALSADAATRQAAVDSATANGDPPAEPPVAPAPAPSPAPVPESSGPDPVALNDYASRRLRVGPLTIVRVGAYNLGGTNGSVGTAIPITSTKNTWTVYEGAEPLKPRRFAERVGDEATRDRIRKTRAWSIPTYVGLLAAGLGGTIGGFAVGIDESDANDGLYFPLVLGGAGVAVSALIPGFFWQRTTRVASMYGQQEAQEWSDRYNDGLREELGLAVEDTLPVDLSR